MITASDRKVTYILAGLALLTAAVYGQLIGQEFIMLDDKGFIYDNRYVLKGLTWDGILWAFTTDKPDYWHPLTWISLMADISLFGLNPGLTKLVNAIFHFGSACLLFLFLNSTTSKVWPSAAVAALFTVHPMHVESVAWATERKDVLFLFFGLGSLAAYARYCKDQSTAWYAASLVSFALGLMSKITLLTLPALFFLVDYWPLRRIDWKGLRITMAPDAREGDNLKRIILEKVPFFAFGLVLAVVIKVSFPSREWMGYSDTAGTWFWEFAYSYVLYLQKFFIPTGIAAIYPRYEVAAWLGMASAVAIVGLTALSLFLGRKQRWFLVGWFWFAISLSPTIGIFFLQGTLGTICSRFAYLPYIGIYIMLVFGAWAYVESEVSRKAFAAIASGLVLILGGLAFLQVQTWQDSETAFTHASEVAEKNWVAYLILGKAANKDGDANKALEYFEKAYSINSYEYDTIVSLSKLYIKAGKPERMEEMFDRFFERYPEMPVPMNDYGYLLLQQGRLEKAKQAFLTAIQHKDDFALAHNNLSIVYIGQGELDEALKHSLRAVELRPDEAPYLFLAGEIYRQGGEFGKARDYFERALELAPDFVPAKRALQSVRYY